ncbi:MAG: ADP-ribosylglycohydrolase family protein [Candidatus Hydrogenedentes bacterium]|nr:ADP-ribosylglycohydrolase family protein [Candidatus Hydrogenedentota bacterium]
MIRACIAVTLCAGFSSIAQESFLRLPAEEYVNRMTAGWIGQMAGVGYGAPTEFQFNGRMVPAGALPEWKPEYINQFWQDDLYVEMTFLRSLEVHGWEVSHKQAGIDFARSGYPLWHANSAGRRNLRAGIAPPDSGHPQFNEHADDIDYQIEADYSGLIAPGMPNVPIRLGELFGRLVNYGDGIYGGQFVGGMYAAAFFERDPEKIVLAGLDCIPVESQYAGCIRDVIAWWKEYPEEWEAAWRRIEAKYNENLDYRKASCGGKKKEFNIDAKINGAYIVMGLLYGGKDPDKTIEIATRCGQDSDCNPSSAAGILFTSLGLDAIPAKYKSALDRGMVFTHTEYSFSKLVSVCESLARDAVVREGGAIESEDGRQFFHIPRSAPRPSPLEQSWNPGPIANSRYTDAEVNEQIRPQELSDGRVDMNNVIAEFAPEWKIDNCGLEMDPGIRAVYRGRQRVLVTHPDDGETPCVLSREVALPADSRAKLRLVVSHHDGGDWQLVVKVDGTKVFDESIDAESVRDGWRNVEIDLAPHAGKTIAIELLNQPTGWFCEAAYWAEIALVGI